MENIAIIGASGQAKVIIDIVEKEGKFKIAGLVDNKIKVNDKILGYKVLGRDEDLSTLVKKHSLAGVIIAIGDNHIRAKSASKLKSMHPSLRFINAIHPQSSIATNSVLGEGSVVMAGGRVNPGCSIGRFCILNTNSSLDHDSVMKDFSSLAPGVTTGGGCTIGEFSAVGIGAVLIQGIQIGDNTIIGAGSTVLKSIGSLVVAYGSPAKEIRKRNPEDKYLDS